MWISKSESEVKTYSFGSSDTITLFLSSLLDLGWGEDIASGWNVFIIRVHFSTRNKTKKKEEKKWYKNITTINIIRNIINIKWLTQNDETYIVEVSKLSVCFFMKISMPGDRQRYRTAWEVCKLVGKRPYSKYLIKNKLSKWLHQ